MLENERSSSDSKSSVQKCVYYIQTAVMFVLIVIIVLFRLEPILSNEKKIENIAPSFTNELVTFEAYVSNEPDKRYRIQQLELVQLQDIFANEHILDKNHGFILTRVDNFEKFSVGQVCSWQGTLVEPENFDDFDYIAYLKNQKIFFILDNPSYICSDIREKRAGNGIKNNLIDFKENMIRIVDERLNEPHSSLLAGILFGKKRRLEKDFERNTRITGVSHVITASGYNITIFIVMINRVLFFLSKKLKVSSSLILIWLFTVFSGFGSSIIRACIMNSLSLVALLFGRDNKIHISLPLASAIFVFLDPLIVLNVGFFLSISAVLGLMYISPILQLLKEKIIKKFNPKTNPKRKLKFLNDYFFPTLSCTIGTLPISISIFKTFSIWSVFVNGVVTPIIENTMLWGVLSVFFTNIHKPLSNFFFTIVNLQLQYFEYIINTVGNLGIGAWEVPENTANLVAIAVLLITVLTVIYFYPIENEKYNYYLKNS